MATTWNGETLADISTWEWEDLRLGSQFRTADGSLHSDSIAQKNRLRLTWELITKAQRDALKTEYNKTTAGTLSLAGVDSYTAVGVFGSWRANPVGGASTNWNVSFTVETS